MALPASSRATEPLPLDPLGRRLCETFPYLWQVILGTNDPAPDWRTETKFPLRPRVMWRIWKDSSQLIGVRFGSQTSYAVIDIDRESSFHPAQNPESLPLIRAALETIGICRTVLIRSSHSGGLHLYIPLPYEMPTYGLAQAISQCLEAQKLAIAPGQLEIFPNCKAYAIPGTYTEYNAHRLPLQPESGSCLLDDDYNVLSYDLGRFFQRWDLAAEGQDLEALHSAIAVARTHKRPKRRATVIDDWLQDLRYEIDEGWTDYGQTNHLLKTIACHGVVFLGLKGDALAEHVLTTAINLPGYEEWCQHQHEIQMRAIVWARSAENYYWALGSNPKRGSTIHNGEDGSNVIPFNQVVSEDAQRRIRDIVCRLEQEGRFPAKATARAKLIASAGISIRTLYKHRELWHPLQYQSDRNGSCKTPEPEDNSAIFESDPEKIPKSLEPSQDGTFYTFGKNMKGESKKPFVLTLKPLPDNDAFPQTKILDLEVGLEKPNEGDSG